MANYQLYPHIYYTRSEILVKTRSVIKSRIQHQLIKIKSHITFAAGAEIVDETVEQPMVGRLKSPHF